MGKYSIIEDVTEPKIRPLSKHSDHDEAEEYVNKVLSKLGIDPANVPVTPLLKLLSVTYATYKRAFYESKHRDDIFYSKYVEYEKKLRDLTAELIRESTREENVIANTTQPITYLVASDFVHEGNPLDVIEQHPETIMDVFKDRDYDDLIDVIGDLLQCKITEAGLLEKIKDKLIAAVELVHEDCITEG